MKKIMFTIFALAAFVTLTQAQINFRDISFEAAVKQAKAENKLIFLDVYATWCRPCKMLDANVFPNVEVGKFFNEKFINLKINGETPEGKVLMSTYKLTAFPSMIFVDGDGKLIKLVQGYREAPDLLKQASYALDPSTMPSNALAKEYDKNPTRENLKALILALNDDGLPIEERCNEYYKKFPELDLKDNVDFYIFYLVENDVESPLFKKFLQTASELESSSVVDKINAVLNHHLGIAIEKKDIQLVLKVLDAVFPAYAAANEEEVLKDEIVKIIREHYSSNVK